MISILFVCAGNICRSPALQAEFEKKLKERGLENQFFVDSCGTTSYYLGMQADLRMRKAAQARGVHIDHIAKNFEPSFFDLFDYIIAVDRDNFEYLNALAATPAQRAKLYLATAFSQKYHGQDIPDPFNGSPSQFEHVMDMIDDVCKGLLEKLIP